MAETPSNIAGRNCYKTLMGESRSWWGNNLRYNIKDALPKGYDPSQHEGIVDGSGLVQEVEQAH